MILLLALLAGPGQGAAKPLEKLWEWKAPAGDLPQGLLHDPAHPYLYVTLKSGGLAVLKLDPKGTPKEVARVRIKELAGLDAMHLARHGDTLLVALGDHFAARGAKAGLASIDVRDPAAPKVLATWASKETLGGAAAVVADGKHAYLGAMAHGVLVFDVATPGKLRHVTTFKPDPDFPRKDPNKVQHPNARGFALAGNRLYVANDAGGVRVLDVSDPAKPKEIGRHINARMGKKQQAYNNLLLDGTRLYAAIDYAGLEVLDVSRPSAIKQLAWWNPWKAETLGNVWFNSPGHTNQIEFDRKKGLLYLSAGGSELQVVDVSRPGKPVLAAHFGGPKSGRGTWGVALGPGVAYLSYITAAVPFKGTWAGVVAVKRR